MEARHYQEIPQIPTNSRTMTNWRVCSPQMNATDDQNMLLQSASSMEERVLGIDSWTTFDQQRVEENMSKSNKPKKKVVDKRYRRYEKPPYSYVALIALAIRSSDSKKLKLSEILSRISAMFPFFQGEYQGWRDSVRHNLSQNKCFKKVLPDPCKPHSKGNYWSVDVKLIPADKLKRQNTCVSRNVAPGLSYASDLKDIFDLQTGKPKTTVSKSNSHGFFAREPSSDNEFEKVSTSTKSYPNETLTVWNEQTSDTPQDELPIHSDQVSSTTDSYEQLKGEEQRKFIPDDASDISESLSDSSSESSKPMDSSDGQNESETLVSEQPRLTARNLVKVMKKQLKLKKLPPKKRKLSQNTSERKRENRRSSDEAALQRPATMQPNLKPTPTITPQIVPTLPIGTQSILPNRECIPPLNASRPVAQVPSWSRMDKALGPNGPPNVTWLSSDPLKSVKAFFNPNQSVFSSTERAENSNFRDQTDFLAEQASILEGRRDNIKGASSSPNFHIIRASSSSMNSTAQLGNFNCATQREFHPAASREWRATQPYRYTSAPQCNFSPLNSLSGHQSTSAAPYQTYLPHRNYWFEARQSQHPQYSFHRKLPRSDFYDNCGL